MRVHPLLKLIDCQGFLVSEFIFEYKAGEVNLALEILKEKRVSNPEKNLPVTELHTFNTYLAGNPYDLR